MMQKSKYFILKNVISTYFLQPLSLCFSLYLCLSVSLALSEGEEGKEEEREGRERENEMGREGERFFFVWKG